MTTIITRKQTRDYVFTEVVDAIEESYRLLGQGQLVLPPRFFTDTENGGDYLYSAATNLKRKTFVVRGSAFMPWNAEKGVSTVTGAYMYSSFLTGEVLAMVEGTEVVKLRTAAKSAVAANYLAKNNSSVIGFVGLGQQAKMHAEILTQLFPITSLLGYSRNPQGNPEPLAYIKEKTGLEVTLLESPQAVAAQADILVVATHATEPLVSYADLHPGQLVLALDHAESVAKDIVLQAKTYVDFTPTAENENAPVKMLLQEGKLRIEDIAGELSDLVLQKVPARTSDEEIILFQSLGVMNEDLATVEYLYERNKGTAESVDLIGE